MKKLISFILVFAFALLNFSVSEENTMFDYQPFYELTGNYGFKLGAPLSYSQLFDTAYLDVVKYHFNSITCTNEMKAYSLLNQSMCKRSEDGMPRMDYTHADAMVQWAQDNGIGVRGHVLVWDAYMTDWFFHEDYDTRKPYADTETMRQRLKSYIEQVVTHFEEKFPGVVYCWDVVNEAVGDSILEYDVTDARHVRTMRSGAENPFYKYVGSDYIEYSFLCARDTLDALGSDCKLYYNDYNTFYSDKRTAITALIGSINSYAVDADGQPRKLLDGIGMQGYIGGYGQQSGCMNNGDLTSIKQSILAYSALGVEVQITEMAVRNYDPDQADAHAEFYARLFKVFRSLYSEGTSPLKAVSIWGLIDYPTISKDNYTYKMNGSNGGLITEKYQSKKATELVYDVLLGN